MQHTGMGSWMYTGSCGMAQLVCRGEHWNVLQRLQFAFDSYGTHSRLTCMLTVSSRRKPLQTGLIRQPRPSEGSMMQVPAEAPRAQQHVHQRTHNRAKGIESLQSSAVGRKQILRTATRTREAGQACQV